MKRTLQKISLCTVIAVMTMASAELNARELPLIGAFSGTGNDFAGSAFPIGRFIGVFDPLNGTAEWTARRGTLNNQTIRFEIGAEVFPGVFYYEQSVIFTGGTGKYKGVTGAAEFAGFIDPVTGEYIGLIDGTLIRE